MTQRLSFYAPQLDGLRFVAAFLVFVHHAPSLPVIWRLKDYGWIGVDLFLAISAYLLTRLLCLEWQSTGKIGFKDFFIRRALRIWPLYFAYVTIMCLLAFVTSDVDPTVIFAWWASSVTFTSNLMAAINGYSPVPHIEHLWTIALEEQAYIVLPLVLMAFLASTTRQSSFAIGAAILVLVLICARAGFSLVTVDHPFIWVLPLRADPFILGAAAAIVVADRIVPWSYFTLAMGALLLLTVPLFPSVEEPGAFQVIGYTVVAIGSTAIVVALQAPGALTTLLSLPILRYFGKISYGIYVYHWFCINMVERLAEAMTLPQSQLTSIFVFSLSFVMTLGLAAVSYEYFEKVFLRMKERYSRVESRPI